MYYMSQVSPDDPRMFQRFERLSAALNASRVECGFAALADVTTKRLDDRMDSFFLSETLVYLYLSVAPPEMIHARLPWSLTSSVFSTEGQLFPLPVAGLYAVTEMPVLSQRVKDLFPASEERPLLRCSASNPFEL